MPTTYVVPHLAHLMRVMWGHERGTRAYNALDAIHWVGALDQVLEMAPLERGAVLAFATGCPRIPVHVGGGGGTGAG